MEELWYDVLDQARKYADRMWSITLQPSARPLVLVHLRRGLCCRFTGCHVVGMTTPGDFRAAMQETRECECTDCEQP